MPDLAACYSQNARVGILATYYRGQGSSLVFKQEWLSANCQIRVFEQQIGNDCLWPLTAIGKVRSHPHMLGRAPVNGESRRFNDLAMQLTEGTSNGHTPVPRE